jgi:Short tail fibre protein receptor-binding domain
MSKTVFNNGTPSLGVKGTQLTAEQCNGWQNHLHDGLDADGHATKLQRNHAADGLFVPVGAVMSFARSTPPPGWLESNGTSIGDAQSGATARAAADTFELYTIGWADWGTKIFTSAAVETTKGVSAAADFAAHNRLKLLDLRDDFIRGANGTTRAVGTREEATIEGHKHLVPFGENRGLGGFPFGQTSGGKAGSGSSDGDNYWMFTNDGTDYLGETLNRTGLIGNETRPRNVALLYCIKY